MVRVATYDPGRLRDRFAMLGAEISRTEIKILIAKEWKKTDFTVAAAEIAAINKDHKFNYHIVEANNQGVAVIDLLKRYHHMSIIPVTTTKHLVDPVKIRLGKAMDKNTTVEWVEWARNEGIVIMPKGKWSAGIKELNKQLARFVGKNTGSGMKYEAADVDDHDDLVMALVIMCHFARRKILGLTSTGIIHGANRKTALDEKTSPLEQSIQKITTNLKNKGFTLTGVNDSRQ